MRRVRQARQVLTPPFLVRQGRLAQQVQSDLLGLPDHRDQQARLVLTPPFLVRPDRRALPDPPGRPAPPGRLGRLVIWDRLDSGSR